MVLFDGRESPNLGSLREVSSLLEGMSETHVRIVKPIYSPTHPCAVRPEDSETAHAPLKGGSHAKGALACRSLAVQLCVSQLTALSLFLHHKTEMGGRAFLPALLRKWLLKAF